MEKHIHQYGLSQNIQAGSIAEPILELVIKGTSKLIKLVIMTNSEDSNETNSSND